MHDIWYTQYSLQHGLQEVIVRLHSTTPSFNNPSKGFRETMACLFQPFLYCQPSFIIYTLSNQPSGPYGNARNFLKFSFLVQASPRGKCTMPQNQF